VIYSAGLQYFLDKFPRPKASARRVLYPSVLVRTLVEILEPTTGASTTRVAGRAACLFKRRSSSPGHNGIRRNIAVYWAELNERTWRMAKMNLAIHGSRLPGLGSRWGDTFARDIHPDVVADFVLGQSALQHQGLRRPQRG